MVLSEGMRRVGQIPQAFGWRTALFFAALFLVYGVSLPYLPVLLDARGLSSAEIGLISSVPLIVRLVLTPLVAMHADRHGDHRGVVIALVAAASAAILVVAGVRGFWPLLLAVTAFLVTVQSVMPLAETIAMAGVRRHGHDYGRMRLCGSATFVLATIIGAQVIGAFGPDAVAGLLIAATVATLAAALALARPERDAAQVAAKRMDMTAALALATARPVLLFLLAAGATQSAHAVFYAFGVLHWRAAGISPFWIGTLWSIGVVAEIALFWWSAKVLARVSAIDLIGLGAAAALVRWTAMAFDPPLAALVPLQLLHGLTYGASHLGAMHFIQGRVPDAQAGTAQALYSTVSAGVGMGLALMIAGQAYGRYGGVSYLAMALLAAVGLAAALALRRQRS
jgi:MFS transporter, PPP family, 3-phenylpropionic acid transporter